MDNRFEGLVLRAIAEDAEILEIEHQQSLIYARYPEGKVTGFTDVEIATALHSQHITARHRVRDAEEAFWAQVRPHRPFMHARYITKERLPERCVITKLMYCPHGELFQVYYRTADGEGMRTKCDPWFFRTKSFGEWAQ